MNELIKLVTNQWQFLFSLVWDHIWISGLSILLALILGVGLGIFISFKKSWAGVVIGIVNILYTIPSFALLGILISITGIGNKTAMVKKAKLDICQSNGIFVMLEKKQKRLQIQDYL